MGVEDLGLEPLPGVSCPIPIQVNKRSEDPILVPELICQAIKERQNRLIILPKYKIIEKGEVKKWISRLSEFTQGIKNLQGVLEIRDIVDQRRAQARQTPKIFDDDMYLEYSKFHWKVQE